MLFAEFLGIPERDGAPGLGGAPYVSRVLGWVKNNAGTSASAAIFEPAIEELTVSPRIR